MNMVYLILAVVVLSIWDIRYLKNKKKDLFVYVILMLLVLSFGIFYFANPERDSFLAVMYSLLGKEGWY